MRIAIHIAIFAVLTSMSCKQKTHIQSPSSDVKPQSKVAANKNKGTLKTVKLHKSWTSDTTMTTSESVCFDASRGLYYVSCINGVPPTKKDGDGFIAIIDLDGKTENQKWATGLSAPKGMALKGNDLYVTDITDLVILDKITGKEKKRINVPGSSFLNDVALAPNGKIYFTDSNENTIYQYDEKGVSIYKKDKGFGGSNGIFVDEQTIHTVGFSSGDIHRIDLKSKKITKAIKAKIPGGDGIAPFEGGFLMSNWNGEVYFVDKNYQVSKILDTKESKINAADITINPLTKELLVPTFFDNRVMAYKIEPVY